MREILAQTASEHLDTAPDQLLFKDGYIRQNGHKMPFAEVVKKAREENRPTRYLHEYLAPTTKPLTTHARSSIPACTREFRGLNSCTR